jgi:ATP-dependent Clp protease adaptor protein ClpS
MNECLRFLEHTKMVANSEYVLTGLPARFATNPTPPGGPGNPNGPTDPTIHEPGGPTAILEKREERLKPPPMFEVYLLNDDYTPMEFVVLVLQKFFGMGRENATQVMLKVHREGRGICGVFPKDVASTKVEQVAQFSKQQQHPLQCVMEEA